MAAAKVRTPPALMSTIAHPCQIQRTLRSRIALTTIHFRTPAIPEKLRLDTPARTVSCPTFARNVAMAIDDKRRRVRPTEKASLATIKDTKEGIEYDLDALSEGGDSSEELLEDSEESEDEGDGLSLSDSDSEEDDGDDTQAKLLARLNGGSSDEEDVFEEEAFDVLISTLAVRDLVPDL